MQFEFHDFMHNTCCKHKPQCHYKYTPHITSSLSHEVLKTDMYAICNRLQMKIGETLNGFEVFTMMATVIWDVVSCSMVEVYFRF
jgi:hypothetical protein